MTNDKRMSYKDTNSFFFTNLNTPKTSYIAPLKIPDITVAKKTYASRLISTPIRPLPI